MELSDRNREIPPTLLRCYIALRCHTLAADDCGPFPCLDLYPALGDLRTSVSSCRQNSGGSRGILAP